MWPDVHVELLQAHEVGEDFAEVTEGNPWPIGHVWERLRYDWSDPRALRGTVVDSNLFKPGSTWELWATPEDGGSRVEIRAVRHLRGRGWLLAPFFLSLPFVSAAATVRAHLRHFLGSIDAPDPIEGDEGQPTRSEPAAPAPDLRPGGRPITVQVRWPTRARRG